MKLNLEEYQEGDKVELNYKEDDGGGWYWEYKKKKGTVHYDDQGFYVTTDVTKHVRTEDITTIKKV